MQPFGTELELELTLLLDEKLELELFDEEEEDFELDELLDMELFEEETELEELLDDEEEDEPPFWQGPVP